MHASALPSQLKPTGRMSLQFWGRRVADTLTFMELMAPEYSETIMHRQPVSLLRTTVQHASVRNGGLSPWTAGKHTDKEVAELEHAFGGPAAATLRKCPSSTRAITDTSASNAWTVEKIFAFVVFSIVALLKLC